LGSFWKWIPCSFSELMRSMELQGIHFQKEPKRFYPARDLAA